jgi:hypothetical protein
MLRDRDAVGAAEHDIADSLLRKWREHFLAAGAERLSRKAERTEVDELRARVAKLERALGRKTMEVEVAGELLQGWERDGASPGPASSSLPVVPQRSWRACCRCSQAVRGTTQLEAASILLHTTERWGTTLQV